MSQNQARTLEFDYVVVGAGSAGCVVAARLGADPTVTVALIEAGPTDDDSGLRVPLHSVHQFGTTRDWGLATVAQPGLDGRVVYWPRGKGIGGCSTMNFQMWVPGFRADFHDWQAAAGPSWSWELMSRHLRRAERWAGNTAEGFGSTGPQWISPPADPDPSTRAFLDACAAAGLPGPAGGLADPAGAGSALTPLTQRDGSRFSVADAYLRPAVARGEVTVLTDRTVHRILLDDNDNAVAVDLGDQTVVARREIVLSAGTVGSAQLLLRSGIGPGERIAAAGVRPRVDLPGVGANLHDHVIMHLPYSVVGSDRFADLAGAEARRQYDEERRGPLTSNIGEAVAFVGPGAAPDLELIWSPIALDEQGFVSGRTLSVVLLRPDSRGRLDLIDADPATPPRLDPAYLTAPADLSRLIDGYHAARTIARTAPLASMIGAPLVALPDTRTEIADFVRASATTVFHPVGTCRIGRAGDEMAVVDEALRVRGVGRLRVADASVIPRSPRGHTNAHAVMIGERAAELIGSAGAPLAAVAPAIDSESDHAEVGYRKGSDLG
ncbi:GMC family oxidoreductase [Nocardia cyriacigeorgica]|uniref:GMC family oxidoreductase n=3 Tax=Nocardia cyriacigeorgica TaxID=135487 RepID=UPI0024587BB1|nr:GMC family oxidoreductase N-terminal domain-containing protein [Nocardia cyriacigeorgica]